jgi:hypothetical protein
MTPYILFLIFSALFAVPGILYRDSGGTAFLVPAGFMALFSGIYWLFKKGNLPLSPRLGYLHAVLTAAGMFILSAITRIVLIIYSDASDSVSFPGNTGNRMLAQLSAGVILFLAGQIIFVFAIISALGRARKQKQL